MKIEIPLNDRQHKVLLYLLEREDLIYELNDEETTPIFLPLANKLLECKEKVVVLYSDLKSLTQDLATYSKNEPDNEIRKEISNIRNIIYNLYTKVIFGPTVLKALYDGETLICGDLQVRIVDNELRMMDGKDFSKMCILSVNTILEKAWTIVR